MQLSMFVLLQVIVIEEFSMLSAHFLDKLEAVARIAKSSREVFGGVRIILVGDAAKLALVNNLDSPLMPECQSCVSILLNKLQP